MSSCMQPPLQSMFDLTYLTPTNNNSQIDQLFEPCHRFYIPFQMMCSAVQTDETRLMALMSLPNDMIIASIIYLSSFLKTMVVGLARLLTPGCLPSRPKTLFQLS